MSSSLPNGAPTSLSLRPFLHPTISRLRSYTPNASPASSATSAPSAFRGVSPVPSSFSTLSPGSSSAHLSGVEKHDFPQSNGHIHDTREVFRWTQLRSLANQIFARPPQKAQAVLGAAAVGTPTVLAANGLICIGTDNGRVLVFDFKQTLKCVCGDPASGEHNPCFLSELVAHRETAEKTVGAVTALAAVTRSYFCRSRTRNWAYPALRPQKTAGASAFCPSNDACSRRVRAERRTPGGFAHRQYRLRCWAAHRHCHRRPDGLSILPQSR